MKSADLCVFAPRRLVRYADAHVMTKKNYSRQEVAKHQLETAIRLYNEGDFLSAITLAAAPEEVLEVSHVILGDRN